MTTSDDPEKPRQWPGAANGEPAISVTPARRECDVVVRGLLALRGGAPIRGEIGIRDGRIAAIGDERTLCGSELVDGRGALILPGVVDVHVHAGSDPGEGIERATQAAASGGVTTIVDMPFDATGPVSTGDELAMKVQDVNESAVVDVALYGTLPASGALEQLGPLTEGGVAAFKLSTFETDAWRFPRSTDFTILLAMEQLRSTETLIAMHSENDEIVQGLTARLASTEDRHVSRAHAASRPPVAENEAIAGVLELAAATGAAVHLCHVTTARGVTLAGRARADGVDVTAETCTHYLVLDERELERQAGRAKVNPPLRRRSEVEALWGHIATGGLDIVSSDHVGWQTSVKDRDDIFAVAAGFPTVELTLPLLFSEGVVRRGLPLARLLEVVCEAPARRYGLQQHKGSIAIGSDADLVVFDSEASWRITNSDMVAAAGWSPYNGREVRGRVVTTLLRGKPVFLDGHPTGAPGCGRFIRPTDRPEPFDGQIEPKV